MVYDNFDDDYEDGMERNNKKISLLEADPIRYTQTISVYGLALHNFYFELSL